MSQTTMTPPAPAQDGGEEAATDQPRPFVAYDYAAVPVTEELAPLARDAYVSFGWEVEGRTPTAADGTRTLALKRDRLLKNKPLVDELQRTGEGALAEIARLERSKTSRAAGVALALGLVATAFVSGAVFAYTAELYVLFVVLSAIGLFGCGASYFVYDELRSRRTSQVGPLIDAEYGVLFQACAQSAGLLR